MDGVNGQCFKQQMRNWKRAKKMVAMETVAAFVILQDMIGKGQAMTGLLRCLA